MSKTGRCGWMGLCARVVLAGLALLPPGCGSGPDSPGLPGSDPAPPAAGVTGSLLLHVVWPQSGSRVIPPETTLIDIEVTGEGLASSRTARIARPASSARIDNLPVGQKGVAATARAREGGPPLAYGFATTVVRAGQVGDVAITLRQMDEAGVEQARALMQEVRDAAITLQDALAAEIIHQGTVWTTDLAAVYGLTLQRLDFVNKMLTREHKATVDGEPMQASLTSLPAATYSVRLTGSRWWWDWELEKIGEAPQEDTWVLQFPQSDALLAGMTLAFRLQRQVNNLNIDAGEFRVTSSREPLLLYQGNLALETDGQARITGMTVEGSFQDAYLTEEITVEGTLTGEPAGDQTYSQARFSGRIEAAKLAMRVGEATAVFDAPAGAGDWWYFVTRAQLKDFTFEIRRVLEPMRLEGDLTMEAVIDEQTPANGPLPRKASFAGLYQSPTLTLSGSIAFDWQNPQRTLTEPPRGTASLQGRWVRPNRPVFSVSLAMTANSPFEVDIDIARGDHSLRGTLSGDWEVNAEGDLKVTEWSLALRNEGGLTVEFSQASNEGVIQGPQGNKLADIRKDPDLKLWLVRYIDGFIESLLPVDISYSPYQSTAAARGDRVDDQTAGRWRW